MSRVIVAGSINMDIITRVSNLPARGETISGKSVEYMAGGKGLNQATACAKMGEETFLIGRLGNDVFAEALTDFLRNHGINIDYIKESSRESGTAFITVADNGQNTIVVVAGSNADVSPEDVLSFPIAKDDVVISQFEIPLPTIIALFKQAKAIGAQTILNPSPIVHIPEELLRLTDFLIVNETELEFINDEVIIEEISSEEIIKIAQKIRKGKAQTVIVTLGHRGALVIEYEEYLIMGHQVDAIDTVGAGDCFAGVFASQLVKGKTIRESVETANKASSICVTRKGAAPSMPEAHEL